LRIGMLGTRGVPARFGGSETAVEEIGSRLVQRGHEVTVYCRKHNSIFPGNLYKGMKRVVLPSVNTLNLDLMSHTFISLLDACGRQFDVVHFHGVGNALQLPLLKLTGAKSLLIVDGLDWMRPKWGRLAKLAFRVSFPMAARLADEIISDNLPAQAFFRQTYGRDTHMVGYGADLVRPKTQAALVKYGLKPHKYIMQVGALVPDKGAHVLVEAYEKIKTDMPLVIVGDTPYLTGYKTKVQSTTDSRIRFVGYVFGQEYQELLANCLLYVHPVLVEGTSPALLQAMAYGCPIITSDLPETSWTLADTGIKFRAGDVAALGTAMAEFLARPEQAQRWGSKARQRVRDYFTWDQIADQYEALSLKLLNVGKPEGRFQA
jgi:glycosyltransferase involved in cell wall biosynthesis